MAQTVALACILMALYYSLLVCGNSHDNRLDSVVSNKLDGEGKCRGKEEELRFIMLLNRIWLPIWNVISTNVQTAAAANNDFTFKLYKMLDSGSSNIFYSPFSISSAFALIHASANGKSKLEVADVFGFKEIGRYFDVSLGLYYQVVDAKSTDSAYFHTANKIWIDQELGVLKSFCDKLKLFYGGTISTLDFKRNAEQSRVTINRWIQDKTEQKINNALTPGTINRLTDSVVTNAIYFKGSWLNAFDPNLTRVGKFFTASNKVIEVNMMRRTGLYMYAQDNYLMSEIIELPYSCGKFSMLIIVPDSTTNINRVETLFPVSGLKRVIDLLHEQQMTLILPKFRLSTSYDLVPSLKALGIREIFSKDADFSGLTGKREGLSIQDVIHKAFIEVNEKGTVSAAVTATIRGRSLLPSLRIDRPFIFVIRDRETNTILFNGRITNPLAK